MRLNLAERFLINNPACALVQRFYEVPLLHSFGGIVPGGRVLEIGCGRGVGLALLLEKFSAGTPYGIDLDPLQVQRARQRLEGKYGSRIDLKVADVEHLPFADASFEAVFDFSMLHHVPEWQAGIAEICRVLRPGGTFFFEEVTRAALNRWIYRTLLAQPSENRFSEVEFVQQLQAHCLEFSFPIKRVLFGDIFIGAATLKVDSSGD